MTLVDTNVLIDILTRDPLWAKKSGEALQHRAALGPILFVEITFAELAAGFTDVRDCSDFVDAIGLEHSAMSRQSLWRAARAFRDYRLRGGIKTNVLPDFFIGAQASVLGVPLLTRDAARYRTYFPEVELAEPG